jgi:hypothetical protein
MTRPPFALSPIARAVKLSIDKEAARRAAYVAAFDSFLSNGQQLGFSRVLRSLLLAQRYTPKPEPKA